MPYPSLAAGQRITAALLRSMLPLDAIKPSDTTRTSTTTLADDPDLVLTLEASATYYVEIFIHYSAASTEQLKTAWRVPSGASGLKSAWGPDSTVNDATPAGIGRWGLHGFTTTCAYGTRTTATNQIMALETGHVITAGAGTMALQWAQQTSGATGVRVATGSYIRAKRIS